MIDRSSRAAFAGSLVTRAAFLLGSLFLLAGVGLAVLAALLLIRPDLAAGSAMLTYGRVFPAGGSALVFGWLTLGLIGIAFHAVPRLVGAPLAFPIAALGLVLLTAAGAGAGTGFLLLGDNAGGRWVEFPLIADGVMALAALGVAGLLGLTARRGAKDRVPLAAWYLIAAPLWLFLGYASGAVPGLGGLGGEIQAAFSGTAVFALWLQSTANDARMAAENITRLSLGPPGQELVRREHELSDAATIILRRITSGERISINAAEAAGG